MKWNKTKYICLSKIYINLQQFQVTPENKTYKLSKNNDKKERKSKQNWEEKSLMDKSIRSF